MKWVKGRGQANIDSLNTLTKKGAISAVFAINCLHHVVTFDNSQISQLEIKGTTLEEAVDNFLNGKKSIHINDDCGDEIACNPACPANYEAEF